MTRRVLSSKSYRLRQPEAHHGVARFELRGGGLGLQGACELRLRAHRLRGRAQLLLVAPVGQGLTLVPISAQLQITLPISAQLKLALSPAQPKFTRGCGPKVLKLSSNVSDVSRRSSS